MSDPGRCPTLATYMEASDGQLSKGVAQRMHASGFAVASAQVEMNKVYGQLDAVTPHSIGRGVANAASSEQDVLDASAPASAVTLTSGTTLSATSRTGVIVLPSGVGQPLSTTYAFDSQYSAAVPASNMKAPRFVDTLGNVVGHAQSGLGFHTVTTPYIQNMATIPEIAGVSSDVAACVNVWPVRQEPTSATPPNFPPYDIHSITTSSLIPQQLTTLGPSDTMSTYVVPSHITAPTQQQQLLTTLLQQLPPIPTHTPFVAYAVTSTSAVDDHEHNSCSHTSADCGGPAHFKHSIPPGGALETI